MSETAQHTMPHTPFASQTKDGPSKGSKSTGASEPVNMDSFVKLLFPKFIEWIKAHPEASITHLGESAGVGFKFPVRVKIYYKEEDAPELIEGGLEIMDVPLTGNYAAVADAITAGLDKLEDGDVKRRSNLVNNYLRWPKSREVYKMKVSFGGSDPAWGITDNNTILHDANILETLCLMNRRQLMDNLVVVLKEKDGNGNGNGNGHSNAHTNGI